MEGSRNTYFGQPLLFQPQPISAVDLPIVFSAAHDDQGLTQLPYGDMYNSCYPSSMNCGQPTPNTPLQQWAQYSEEQRNYGSNQMAFPNYTDTLSPVPPEMIWAQPQPSPQFSQSRSASRAASFTSNASTWVSCPQSDLDRSDLSRSSSPNASEMAKWGRPQDQGTWRCAYPGCTSKSIFRRGCDLRKHYRRHTKSLFCRTAGCKQATEGGFSSEKDRARHEAKHNPQIACEFTGCSRVFSRVDNMRDHVRRIHRRKHTH